MMPSLSALMLWAVLGVLLALPSAFGLSLLTDAELDEFGAGGAVSLVHQAGKQDVAPLSDEDLEHITGMWAPEFIWPFQYVPDKFIGHAITRLPQKGNAPRSRIDYGTGSKRIPIKYRPFLPYSGIQFRGTPSSEGGLGIGPKASSNPVSPQR